MKKSTLMWIAILPIAVVSIIVSNIILKYIYTRIVSMWVNPNSHIHYIVSDIIASAFSCFIFVYSGYKCSPKYKKEVALILTALLCLITGGSFVINMMTNDYMTTGGLISGIAGAVFCCIQAYRGELDNEIN